MLSILSAGKIKDRQNCSLVQAVARDERRWKNMEEEEKIEQERVEKLRAQGTKAKSNQKSTPYDPLTLNYDNSEAGKKLK